MTPTETAAILRQFNKWRRGDETVEQPDPREIGEAIDAAIEMIERLEAAEKSDAESIAMYRKARDERDALRAELETERMRLAACGVVALSNTPDSAKQARDMRPEYWSASCGDVARMVDENIKLRAKIDAMEQQKPIAWVRKLGLDLPSVGCVTDLKYRPSNIPESSYIPLYLAPGAKGEIK